MSALRWSAREDGGRRLEEWIAGLEHRIDSMHEPLERSAGYVQDIMRLAFVTEGAFRSGGWEPLNEDYELWKDVHFPGEPMLRMTGEMETAVLSDSSWEISDNDAIFLPPSEKAGWHQEGLPFRQGGGRTHNKSNPLPARPILDLNEEDYQHIDDIFDDWLRRMIAE